jgi:ferrochelatase
MATPRGLLLVNLGTPEAPTTGAVRRYLREFLSDPRVIDIPGWARQLLLQAIILPFRSPRSAAAYRKVWTERGSPLLSHSQDLAAGVQARLGEGWAVELAMRYGRPSIPEALERLSSRGARELVVFPLYPQAAASSTGSTVARVYELLSKRWDATPVRVVPAFFDDAGFLEAFAEVARPVLATEKPDHVLFSFHGLPERHMKKSDPTGAHCLASAACCERLTEANRGCYRAQSYFTARALAQRLALAEGRWSVSFQSRLGRTPWIQPFTDVALVELAKAGVKHLAVVCPAFVADCLETLEEIGLRANEAFRAAGGERLTLVPWLNSSPAWVATVARLAVESR